MFVIMWHKIGFCTFSTPPKDILCIVFEAPGLHYRWVCTTPRYKNQQIPSGQNALFFRDVACTGCTGSHQGRSARQAMCNMRLRRQLVAEQTIRGYLGQSCVLALDETVGCACWCIFLLHRQKKRSRSAGV